MTIGPGRPQVKKTVKKPVKKTIKKSPADAKFQETLNTSDLSKNADNVHDLTGENSQALAESSQKHQTLSALKHSKHLENSSLPCSIQQ